MRLHLIISCVLQSQQHLVSHPPAVPSTGCHVHVSSGQVPFHLLTRTICMHASFNLQGLISSYLPMVTSHLETGPSTSKAAPIDEVS